MMRRLVVVYNPRSSRHTAIEAEVLAPARKLSGWMVCKYEVKETNVDDNVKVLAKLLEDGDLMISAGGDGTAVIAANGVMASGKDVTLGVLGYGNFNDMARMLKAKRPVEYGDEYVGGITEIIAGFEAGKIKEIHPLEAIVDDEHWRYVPCYLTLGLFAESTAVFDDPKVRQKLRTGKKRMGFSVWTLAKWYFGNRKREFLPAGKVNGVPIMRGMTDYIAVNGRTMAKMMKGGKWYLNEKEFVSATVALGGIWGLMRFMTRSIMVRIPGKRTKRDVIEFARPSDVEIHAEGEYQRLEGVSTIEVKKAGVPLKVIRL